MFFIYIMPFVIELLQYTNDVFIETGTYKGDTLEFVRESNKFKTLHSMELSEPYHKRCSNRFVNYENVKVHHGNSRYDLVNIIRDIDTEITFWLDSHWSGGAENFEIGCDPELKCQVLHELDQIKNHPIKTHTIIVHHIRLMDGSHFEVTLDQINQKILEINPNYKIKFYNDECSEKNVLVAYIDSDEKICIHNYLNKCITNEQPPGLGDFIRGSIALFGYCKKYGFKLYFDNKHELFNTLDKNEYIIDNSINSTIELIPPMTYDSIDNEIEQLFLKNENICVLTNSFYRDDNGILGVHRNISNECKLFLRNIFKPNSLILNNMSMIFKQLDLDINKTFNVIHLRFGDEYTHNDTLNNDYCMEIEQKIKTCLTNYPNEPFILLSNSNKNAEKIVNDIPNIFYINSNKIHLGDLKSNGDTKQSVIDTMTDFFIMSICNKIFVYRGSGFSNMSSIIFDKPFINICDL